MRILLIEDNPGDALLIREMLAEAGGPGIELLNAQRLSAGIELVDQHLFDVVLLDLGLPDSQGLDALKKMQEKAPHLPQILLTGLKNEDVAVRAVEIGAQDYLVKGHIDGNLLIRSIRYAIQRKKAQEELRKAKELSDAVNYINSIIDLTIDFNVVMQRIMSDSIAAIKADSGIIYLKDEEGWTAAYVHGLPQDLQGKRFAKNAISFHSFTGRNGRTLLVSEAINPKVIETFNIRAIISVPLAVGEEVFGAFSIHYSSPDKDFSDLEFDFANKVAASVSLAVSNARLYDQRAIAQKEFEQLSRKYELILQSAAEGIFGIDLHGNHTFVNAAAAQMLGYTPAELVGKNSHLLWHHSKPDGSPYPASECRIFAAIQENAIRHDSDEVFWRKDGSCFAVEYTCTAVKENGRVTGAVVTFRDITARKEVEAALRKSEEKFRDLFEHANDPIFVVDQDLHFKDVNMRAEELVGYSHDELLSMNILEIIIPDQVQRVVQEFEKLRREGGFKNFVTRIRRKDGEFLDIEISSSAIYEQGEFVGSTEIVRDITESKRMEETIRYQASHDALTGLPNRMLFMDHLSLSLSQARRYHEMLAVMFLDLDRFKNINDTLGHAVGDKLLKAVSERLKSCVRDSDTVARIGGDEYNILLPQLTHLEDAAVIARKIVNRLSRPFTVDNNELHVTSSIGISLFPGDGDEAPLLLKNADIAMYHAKERGRNNFQFYDPAMNVRTIERMRLENSLRQTVIRGELEVFYQPQLDLETKQVISAEALVRWRHPELGLLMPGQFIQLAEETGFSIAMDEWVLKTACEQSVRWQQEGYVGIGVTVNLSARNFKQPNLAESVSRILKETNLDPPCLELEITENVLMEDIDVTIPNLEKLMQLGVSFAIDDFGTGYSSLAHLKKLPIRRLKIDKSFIRNIDKDPDDRAIVNAVIFMGHNLKLKVIAEGVETDNQLRFLHDSDCDEVQGFLVGKPLPPQQFRDKFLQ